MASGDPEVEERRAHFEEIFKLLATAGKRAQQGSKEVAIERIG